MEIWDGYNIDGSLAGVDLVRGEKIPDGLYHLVCEVLVQHTDGDFLLMKRDLNKPVNPGKYEATAGGSALKGENGLTCIKRELYEETIAYKWISKQEFIDFVNSDKIGKNQGKKYREFLASCLWR